MLNRLTLTIVAATLAAGCGREPWPGTPPVDEAQYQREYEEWRNGQQQTAEYAMRIAGIWPLPDGETAFGSDPSLPIAIQSPVVPPRAGVFHRSGEKVRVVPAAGAPLMADGSLLMSATDMYGPLELGSISFQVVSMGDTSPDRVFVMAWDAQHPDAQDLPPIDVYPVDPRWRVAARFDAFQTPRPVRVADVRGGFMEFVAPGELVFQLNDEEVRLTAIGGEGREDFFVMFKDPTNRTTTYGGYRILTPRAVANGEWTVLDFNLAFNPPCAYSRYTTCPLPPKENRLDVAVDAGEKRYRAGKGFATPE
jgi:uncharacterized protein (DUF1684 family)